jgi:hypothetical protein
VSTCSLKIVVRFNATGTFASSNLFGLRFYRQGSYSREFVFFGGFIQGQAGTHTITASVLASDYAYWNPTIETYQISVLSTYPAILSPSITLTLNQQPTCSLSNQTLFVGSTNWTIANGNNLDFGAGAVPRYSTSNSTLVQFNMSPFAYFEARQVKGQVGVECLKTCASVNLVNCNPQIPADYISITGSMNMSRYVCFLPLF